MPIWIAGSNNKQNDFIDFFDDYKLKVEGLEKCKQVHTNKSLLSNRMLALFASVQLTVFLVNFNKPQPKGEGSNYVNCAAASSDALNNVVQYYTRDDALSPGSICLN